MPPLKVHFLQPGVEEFKEIQIRPETKQVLDKIVQMSTYLNVFVFAFWAAFLFVSGFIILLFFVFDCIQKDWKPNRCCATNPIKVAWCL